MPRAINFVEGTKMKRKGNSDYVETDRGPRPVRVFNPAAGTWRVTRAGKRWFSRPDQQPREVVVQVPAKDEPTRRRRTSNSDSAVLPLQSPRPCARCNLEPIDTVRRRRRRRRRQYAPSDSAVLPPRSILQGVASASPDSTESQVEDTKDPWGLQRLRDAWFAKEFFYNKRKNYLYGPR